ncbi:hypothetical protein [Rhizobium sp. FKL33]|uniref:hypothetical protein n=1 Tax=Rhizobium sp. FKL33 TaxID=2562307 RepID=UPI001484DA9D|nr:hypothetical protein [Rhizobium sp. FKL33]
MAYAAAKSASLGPAPGEVVAPIVLAFYLGLACIAFFTPDEDGELAHGNVHV